jgi:glycosyltransferase involved in cell wall biosynthesis
MLSAIILSHNDEATIARALQSVSFCDEVIVIDDESTDKTLAIAKKHGATVFTHALNDDFAAQRNFGLAKAKGEWVLFVDSDEVVSPSLADEIQQELAGKTDGWYIKRRDTMWGHEFKYGEMGNVKLLRLARKKAGTWNRPVHEVWDVKGETDTLTHPLLHYPHPDVAQFIEEINRYSTLNAKHFYDKGVRTHVWQIMAYPAAKFFVNYVWKLGFLDGTAGAIVAFLMSLHSFLTRGKLYLLTRT